jgi:ubiquinol oxidase
MTLRKPSRLLRAMVLGAQGVFYNMFCPCSRQRNGDVLTSLIPVLSYIISPRTCHRFVGYIEEEAVLT